MKSPKQYLAIFDELDRFTTGIYIIALTMTLIGFVANNPMSPFTSIKPFMGIAGLAVLCLAFFRFANKTRQIIADLTNRLQQAEHNH